MSTVIEALEVEKRFAGAVAVDRLSFRVAAGECVGFLGPNGAGKTTTIKMLCGQVPVDRGAIRVRGLDIGRHPRAVKARLGICPQEDNLDTDFRVRDNLLLYATYFGVPREIAAPRAAEWLRFVRLWERRDAEIRALSGGMRRALLLARSLMNQPDILVLDEPTTGLDPQARHQVWNAIDELKGRGVTLLLTTHYMDEAERLCDRLLIVDRGRLIAEGPPARLIEERVGRDVVEAWGDAAALGRLTDGFAGEWERAGRRVCLFTDRTGVRPLLERAESTTGIERVLHRPANLEDVFLRLAGRELRD
ncbi:MAG: ATP-binding cassette domain-containing protein [Nitrospirota bacterium]